VTNILNALIDFKSTTTEQKVIQSAGFFIGFGIAFSSKLKNESNRIYYVIGLAIAGLVIGTIASQLLSKKKINN
jgi:mannose/fructose/N-acetylgalactosamine-specific phosphotransferase system component IIC